MTFKEKTFELIGKDKKTFNKLSQYVSLIEEKNRLFNLTGFNGDAIWREGIYQSIILMNKSFPNTENKMMLDIGSGVGFPSIPFLIYKHNFSLFISEPMKKRIQFLNIVNDKLKLNIIFINQRIEDYSEVEQFDIITARAVTSLKNLIEISSKVGKIGCIFSFLKGPKIYEELEKSRWILNKLSLVSTIIKIDIISNFQTQSFQTHYLFNYIKTSQTPTKFPRKWPIISSY